MAKENGKKKEDASAAYFTSLTIENVKCFKGKHTIDLSDGEGKPAQWTVILGNNNTGKTTLLKCLAGMEPAEFGYISDTGMKLFSSFVGVGRPKYIKDLLISINMNKSLISSIVTFKGGGLLDENIFVEDKIWGHGRRTSDGDAVVEIIEDKFASHLRIYSFGASRKISRGTLAEESSNHNHGSLFENEELTNVEDWLLNLFVAQKLGKSEAKHSLNLALEVLVSGILPDVQEAHLSSQEKGAGFENFVEFRTDYGWVRLRDLGYGYQTMIAWVLDLVKRMVERYSNSSNPLAEPAIVLVDEIDLHLHPDWQRRIIAHLTKYFPNTQFIVTAHSPLIVQSADEVNLVILKKAADHVTIEQPKIRSFKGWTVEEILTDLMELEGQTMSHTYIDLMQQFEEALDEDNYEKAKDAYDQLDKILHPGSSQRKLMKIQMTSLSPAETV